MSLRIVLNNTALGTCTGFVVGTMFNTVDFTLGDKFDKTILPKSVMGGTAFGAFIGLCEVNPPVGIAIMSGSLIGANMFYYFDN